MVWGIGNKATEEKKSNAVEIDDDSIGNFIDDIDEVKAADENDYGIIDDGWYPCVFTKVQPKKTDNAQMVEVGCEILATKFKNRKIYSSFITHLSPQEGKDPEKQATAIKIGRAKFKSILEATGNSKPGAKFSDSIGVPCLVKISTEKARKGADGTEYPARNKIDLAKEMSPEQLASLQSGEDPTTQKSAPSTSSKPKFLRK